MLNQFRIARLVQAEEFDRLLNEVLMNARPVPLSARLRLSEPGAALASSALGLALRRVTELSWRPEPPAAELAERLLRLQDSHGGFGSVAASACAVAGMILLLDQIAALPGSRVGMTFLPEGLHARVVAGVDRGLAWLAERWGAGCSAGGSERAGLFDRTEVPEAGPDEGEFAAAEASRPLDAIDTAVVLWQLGASRRAVEALGLGDPRELADALGLHHQRETAALVSGVAGAGGSAGATGSRKKAA